MIYKFIDAEGTFRIKNPQQYLAYLPLTDSQGRLLSSIGPNLSGDIKEDNDHFLTPPVSIEDLRSNLFCRREFFLKTKEKIVRLSFPDKDYLEIGFLYQKLVKRVEDLEIEILNFIPYDLAVEIMRITIHNKGKWSKEFIPTSFIPLYGRSEKNLRDHRHVSSLLNRLTLLRFGLILQPTMLFDEKGHKKPDRFYFALGYQDNGIEPHGQFPTLDFFYGRGDILKPEAIEKDLPCATKKRPDFDGKEACAAFRFKRAKLKPQERVIYTLILGISKERKEIERVFSQVNSLSKVEEKFTQTKNYWLNLLCAIGFDFEDRLYNNWLLWVKLQPILRKLFGCSFLPHFDYGKGGRGWRDLWQDVLSLLLLEPPKAKELILHNFCGVRIDGSNATIITKDNGFIADRNRIWRVWMDHGVWPYLTLRFYLHKTADLNILLEETTYFRDHQLKRGKEMDPSFLQKDFLLRDRQGKIYKGSILEHLLVQHLVQFFNVGEHNIIRLENADWNDGLDMAARGGESVAFSFMYAHNLKDLTQVLERLKPGGGEVLLLEELLILLDRIQQPINYHNPQAKRQLLEVYLEKTKNISGKRINVKMEDLIRDLKEKVEHLFVWLREKEWLEEGFFNGYYDDLGERVEAKTGKKVQMMLTSQVFAIMSGVATSSQVQKIWKNIKRHLQDREHGGFRLNTDFGKVYFALGRAFGFIYGEKENGAFFNHMGIMLANALYKRNFIQEGSTVINSIYKMALATCAEMYPLIPEYFNNQGKGLYWYLTGSATWYIYTLVEEVLGINFKFGDLFILPKLTAETFLHKKIKFSFNWQEKRITVIYLKEKQRKIYRIKKAILQDKEILPQKEGLFIEGASLKNIPKDKISITLYLG